MINNPSITVAAVGDVALAGEFLCRAQPPAAPLTYSFAPLQERLRKAIS